MLDSFGDRLLAILDSRGMNRADLCKMTGLKSSHLVRYVKNPKSSPNLSTAVKIAEALDVSLDYLAGRDGYNEYGHMGNVSSLARDEAELVGDYRRMEPEERETIARTARTFALAGDAKKEEPVEPARVARPDVRG